MARGADAALRAALLGALARFAVVAARARLGDLAAPVATDQALGRLEELGERVALR